MILSDEDRRKIKEGEYKEAVCSIISRDASSTIGKLLGTWLDWSDEDVVAIATATLVVENTYDLLKELSPPERFTSFHQKLLKGRKLAAEAAPVLRKSAYNLNAGLMKKYLEMMEQAFKFNNEANAELEKLE